MATHLELLAPHGLHVAFLADGELVDHGVAAGVVLGPGEVLPILLDLRDDLEVTALFNCIAGEPWHGGHTEGPCKSCLGLWLWERARLLGQATLTVKSTHFSSTVSHAAWANTFPSLSVSIHKMG